MVERRGRESSRVVVSKVSETIFSSRKTSGGQERPTCLPCRGLLPQHSSPSCLPQKRCRTTEGKIGCSERSSRTGKKRKSKSRKSIWPGVRYLQPSSEKWRSLRHKKLPRGPTSVRGPSLLPGTPSSLFLCCRDVPTLPVAAPAPLTPHLHGFSDNQNRLYRTWP